MKAVIAAVAVSLTAGYAIGAGVGGGEEPTAENAPEIVTYIDSTAPIEERLEALERIIAEERNARLVLEDQLGMIFEELEAFDGEITRGGPAEERTARVLTEGNPPAAVGANQRQDFDSREAYLTSQLIDGGFSEDRANWIVERSTEYQWDAMQARYEARQNGERPDWSSLDPQRRLRAELGDTEYEQYLEATGQPSVVSIQSVMATSPASRVGLQPGDEIRSYDGRRIFNMRELQIATNTATPGSDVVVEVMRNGSPMTVSMPAGPLGVQAGASGRIPGWRRGN